MLKKISLQTTLAIFATAQVIGIIGLVSCVSYHSAQHSTTFRYSVMLCGLALLGALGISAWTIWQITRSLSRLTQNIQDFTAGKSVQPFGPIYIQEIATLSEAFCQMRGHLHPANRSPQNSTQILEQQIADRTAAYMEAQRTAKIGSWSWNLVTGDCWLSPQMYQILGLNPGEYTIPPDFETASQNVYPEDRERVHQVIQEAIEQGNPYEIEFRLLQSNGDTIYALSKGLIDRDSEGRIIRFWGVTRDITHCKRAEAAIRESEAKYRSIYNQAAVGIGYANSQQEILGCNQKLCTLLGYDTEDCFINKTITEITHPEDRDLHLPLFQQLFAGEIEQFSIEKRYVRKDGSAFWGHTTVSLLAGLDSGEQCTIAVVQDISDRKRAELALEESEQRFQEVASTISQFFFVESAKTGQITYVSPAYEKIWGRTCQSLYENPRSWMEAIHPDDLAKIQQSLEAPFTEKSVTEEYRIIQPNGEIRWVFVQINAIRDAEGELDRLVGFGADISDRKRMELALRDSERRYAILTEKSPVGIFRFDAAANCRYVNPRWCEMTGRPSTAADGKNWTQVIHPDDFGRLNVAWQKAFSQKASFRNEGRHLLPDGSVNWFDCQMVPEIDEKGDLVGYIGTLTDISDRKQAETELLRYERIFSAIVDGILLVGRNYKYQAVNQTYLDRVGKTYDEIVGHSVSDLLGESVFTSHIKSRLDRCFAGEVVQFEGWFDYANVGRRFVSVNYAPYREIDGSITGAIVSTHDITDRKRIETALQNLSQELTEWHERYYLAAQASGQILFECSLETNQSTWGPNSEEVLGYPADTMPRCLEEYIQLIHPDDQAVFQQVSRSNQVKPYHIEFRFRQADGTYLWVEERGITRYTTDGKPLQVIGYLTDISDRKQAKQALQASEKRYRAIFDQVAVGIKQAELSGRYIIVNQAFCEMLGYTEAELLGLNHQEITHPKDFAKYQPQYEQMFAGQIPFLLHEKRYRHKAGHYVWTQVTVSVLRDSSGQIVSDVAVIVNIDDRKRTEAALRQSEQTNRVIIETIPDLLIRMDREGHFGHMVGSNAVHTKYLSELSTEPVAHDALPLELAEQRLHYVNRALASGCVQSYEQVFDFQGEQRHEEVRIAPLNEQEVLVIIRNITDRKQAEQALQASEERYRAIVDQVTVGINQADLLGRYISANHAFCEMLGYTKAEILALTYEELTHPDDFATHQANYDRITAGALPSYVHEKRYRHKAGHYVWTQVTVSVLRDAEGTILSDIAVVVNIDDRKQAEAALEQSELTNRVIIETIPDLLIQMNREGRHARMLGSSAIHFKYLSELATEPVSNTALPLELVEQRLYYANRALESGSVQMYEQVFELEGEQRYEEVRIAPLNEQEVLVIIRNITDRKQTELALQASEERYRAIFDQVAVGISQTNLLGQFISTNQAFCEMLGYTEAEILNLTFQEITHPDDIAQAIAATEKLFAGQIPFFLFEKRCRHKAGHYLWMQITVSALCDRDGRISCSVGVVVDIDDRKRAEAALQNLIAGTAATIGQDFFPALVKYIAEALDVSYVLVDELVGDELIPLAFWAEGVQQAITCCPSFDISFERVMRDGVFYCAHSVQQQFPDDAALAEMNVESCLCIALYGTQGQIIGKLCVLHQQPIADSQRAEQILRVFAARAAAELERQRASTALKLLNQELEVQVEKRTATLREREQFLQTVLDTFPLSIFWKDRTSVYLGCNRNFLRDMGLTSVADIIGKTDHQLSRNDVEAQAHRADDLRVMEADAAELGIIKSQVQADGKQAWIETNKLPLHNTLGEVIGILGSYHDITDQKQAQEALKKSEARWQFALEGAGYGICDWEIPTNRVFYSRQWRAMLGYAEREMGNTIEEYLNRIHPEDVDQAFANLNQHLQGETSICQSEHRVCCKDGSSKWVLDRAKVIERTAEGKPLRLIGIRADITDRRLSEQKIREQAALLEIASDAIIVRDLNQQIRYWSQGAERLYGWQAAEAIGQNANELFQSNAALMTETILPTLLEKDEWQGELNKVTKVGDEVTVEGRWTLARDDTGKPKFILSVDTDITEKKQLEAQFYQTQRLDSLGRLASGIAHDLNNILTPILAMAQLLRITQQSLDTQAQEQLKLLEGSAKRGADMVSQILTFAQGVGEEQTTVDLTSLLQEVASIAQQSFPKSIEIHRDLPDPDSDQSLSLTLADPTHLHQVFMNLFINARDAMPDGGMLIIAARNEFIDEAFARTSLDAQVGNYVVVTITDTGVGIPPKVFDRIYEPFFTTKQKGKGTGLGLSTVLGIVKNYGGFLQIFSEVGEGTQVKVYLPATEEAVTENDSAEEQFFGRGELILIVDDDETVQQTTQSLLKAHHYTTLIAHDGVEALELYRRYQDEVKLVVSDIMMPKMNGISLILRLKKINPMVKTIAISGMPTNRGPVLAAGADIFLAKPYPLGTLLKHICDLLRS